MRNTRKTLNMRLHEIAATVTGLKLFTGDEANPALSFPALSIQWLARELPSDMSPDFRMALLQLDVETVEQDTDGAEAIADAVGGALGIKKGSRTRLGQLPKKSWAINGTGDVIGTSLGSAIVLRPQLGQGWRPLSSAQRGGRRLSLTLEAHYRPD